MDFIFMLTRHDRTVPDCLAVLDEIAPLGLRHIGFKDIGADEETLRTLNARIKALGAASYLEVVATTPQSALDSARIGKAIGVDRLLGGTEVAATLALLAGTGIGYYPFPGTPVGHPTQLRGDEALVETHCADFIAQGCAGVDLLAYRATEADPLALVRAARRGLGRAALICAGGVDSPARIKALRAAGADGFTVGSAAFDGAFAPGETLAGQLRAIMSCV
ncbi:beta/alpha barrel domain-containing protein [Acidocella facilis]|uniref:hypothetical protein n=1 Tax=Acidocella facilis TaxID=525 RepID=UPI00047B171E|nr:hypothetical protein [Acidocella facilis]